MFFDIGWPELMLIGAVALVVIGPKDLPRALRIAGMYMRKARTLSREFQSSIDQMIREAELEEIREELKKASDLNIEKEIRTAIDPHGDLTESLRPPEAPDFFDDAPKPPTQEAAAEEPAALPPPSEDALPEQPDLPFDAPLPVEAHRIVEPEHSEPGFAPPKP